MPLTGSFSMGLCEGNETLRGLIQKVLGEAFTSVQFVDASTSLGHENVDLLIVDVDSGIADARVELLLKVARASQTPVLVLGLAQSEAKYRVESAGADEAGGVTQREGWLQRPFSGARLVHVCRQLLGMAVEESVAFRAGADEAFPVFPAGFEADEPPTVELGEGYEALVGADSSEEMLELEELLSLDAEELVEELAGGGVLVGSIHERLVEDAELVREMEHLPEPTALLQLSQPSEGNLLSETLSEVSSSGVSSSGVYPAEGSEVVRGSGVSVVSRHRLGSGHSSVSAAGLSPEIVHSITGTARMLAESWDRLGLAVRTEDRADRIERILFALFKDGLQGAASALSRIPRASGLSGSLDVLGLIDVLHLLRERRLRGRLELCVGEQSFVLYIDGGILEDIESLGGSTDAVLLRILREQAAIDEATFQRLSALDEDEDGLGAPLEMRLRIEQLVDDADLRAARRLRARELFGGLFQERRGNYAFIEIREDSGQAWPIEGLRLNIDEMLLRLLREGQLRVDVRETSRSWNAEKGLIFDPVRAASVRSSALADSERELLLFFQAGETIGEARRHFGNAGEDVERIVDRLVRVELLKPHKVDARRANPRRAVLASAQSGSPVVSGQSLVNQNVAGQGSQVQASRIELDFDLDALVAPVHDPHQSPTAVSDWAIPIPGLLEKVSNISDVVFPEGEEDDDALWDGLDLFFERADMSEVSSELPDTGELDQRIFGSGEQDEES